MFPKLNQRFILDFSTKIPHQIEEFRRSEPFFSALKQTIRTYRRFFTLLFLKQLNLELDLIPENASKILWLNPSSTSIGDSIMELSGRKLLNNTKFEVHLLSDRKNSSLYVEDLIFKKVFNDPTQIIENYDLILIDVYNTKSIRMKSKYFPDVPFCAIQGYFYGAAIHRMMFSYHRISFLLGMPFSQEELNLCAKNYLPVAIDNFTQRLVISVGGEDKFKTYSRWIVVISQLIDYDPKLEICIVGSSNGIKYAAEITSFFGERIVNYVAKFTLLETAKIIAGSRFFIGADGGLMHIAESCNINGIALFAKVDPKLFLSYQTKINPLYTDLMVDDINPDQVVSLFKQLN